MEVPRNSQHAKEIDDANGNTFWQDAFGKEVESLLRLGYFDFNSSRHHETLGKG